MGSMLGYPKIKGRSSVRETRNPIQVRREVPGKRLPHAGTEVKSHLTHSETPEAASCLPVPSEMLQVLQSWEAQAVFSTGHLIIDFCIKKKSVKT